MSAGGWERFSWRIWWWSSSAMLLCMCMCMCVSVDDGCLLHHRTMHWRQINVRSCWNGVWCVCVVYCLFVVCVVCWTKTMSTFLKAWIHPCDDGRRSRQTLNRQGSWMDAWLEFQDHSHRRWCSTWLHVVQIWIFTTMYALITHIHITVAFVGFFFFWLPNIDDIVSRTCWPYVILCRSWKRVIFMKLLWWTKQKAQEAEVCLGRCPTLLMTSSILLKLMFWL